MLLSWVLFFACLFSAYVMTFQSKTVMFVTARRKTEQDASNRTDLFFWKVSRTDLPSHSSGLDKGNRVIVLSFIHCKKKT
jgi:hypothetical protein